MGIDLHWEDENGEQLASHSDAKSLLARLLPPPDSEEFPCLRFVDPYGETVFNQSQIPHLLAELEKLAGQTHEREVAEHLHAVMEVVRQARNQVHTYIKFYGD